MTARAELAAAANSVTVDDVALNVEPYYFQTTKVGDGWVALVGLDRDDSGLGYMERWQVTVVLHQDVATAEKWIEANADALVDALEDRLVVTTVVPVQLTMDAGRIPGLVIEGSRPH